jgi:hypothetical protein
MEVSNRTRKVTIVKLPSTRSSLGPVRYSFCLELGVLAISRNSSPSIISISVASLESGMLIERKEAAISKLIQQEELAVNRNMSRRERD